MIDVHQDLFALRDEALASWCGQRQLAREKHRHEWLKIRSEGKLVRRELFRLSDLVCYYFLMCVGHLPKKFPLMTPEDYERLRDWTYQYGLDTVLLAIDNHFRANSYESLPTPTDIRTEFERALVRARLQWQEDGYDPPFLNADGSVIE
jgi:hypothetical protein